MLRYWETEFRSIRPQKSRKGQRIYSRRDVDKLLKVKDLLYTHGFTIAGARKRLREGGLEPATAPEPETGKIGARQGGCSALRGEVVACPGSTLASGGAQRAATLRRDTNEHRMPGASRRPRGWRGRGLASVGSDESRGRSRSRHG